MDAASDSQWSPRQRLGLVRSSNLHQDTKSKEKQSIRDIRYSIRNDYKNETLIRAGGIIQSHWLSASLEVIVLRILASFSHAACGDGDEYPGGVLTVGLLG